MSLAKIGLRIQIARKALGITQGQLAKDMGYTQKGLSRVENGNSDFTVKTLLRIAEALKIPPKFFFEEMNV